MLLKTKFITMIAALFFTVLSLGGCVSGGGYSGWPMNTGIVTRDPKSMPDIAWQTQGQRTELNQQSESYADGQRPSLQTVNTPAPAPARKVNVAILLPLTGKNSDLGQSMLKAAQMALFDVGNANVELMPIDTQSTPDGVVTAARRIAADRPDLVLGPIFADDVKAIKPVIGSTNIPMIAFTTDWTLADSRTYVMGFLPFTQVARVAQYAQSKGYSKVAIYAPQTPYCDIVISTLQRTGVSVIGTERYSPMQSDLSALVENFINKNVDGAASNGLKFNALMLPVGGEGLRSLVSVFSLKGVSSKNVRLLGTGLWDDAALNNSPDVYGGWYAAPDPKLRADFEKRYQDNYGAMPPRLASLAYDATALASVLSHTGDPNTPPYSTEKLTSPRGFAGVDGVFRFRNDGLVERGLAVLEIQSGKSKVVDPAPTAFISTVN